MPYRHQIEREIDAVPALPGASAEALQLVQRPDVSVAELTKAIAFDPGLTANVLRLANSAYYGKGRSIGSLQEATVRLGMRCVEQLVVTAAVTPYARNPLQGYDLPAGDLLRHSTLTAVVALELAEAIRKTPPPRAFTAALLHDLGKIVLGTFVKVDAAPILQLVAQEKKRFHDAEREVLGIDHAEAGALLLQRWSLPLEIVDAVRWHHDPGLCSETSLILDLVHAADAVSMSSGVGAGVDGLSYRLSEAVGARLSLRETMIEGVMSRAFTKWSDLCATIAF
ncbi:MAG TPA: HDOD domain-containing protein [Candidatus Hydrogenedentes bacterium]|nr:HDOD domain-containing protein [Candidatus Hydrogenedentota bacterium]